MPVVCMKCSVVIGYGDLRISGGGRSGRLEFLDGTWGSVCTTGFDDDAGDVACRQLGYVRSTDVYTYGSRYASTTLVRLLT